MIPVLSVCLSEITSLGSRPSLLSLALSPPSSLPHGLGAAWLGHSLGSGCCCTSINSGAACSCTEEPRHPVRGQRAGSTGRLLTWTG